MKKIGGLVVLFVFVLAGCFRNGLQTIPSGKAFIASVNLKSNSITFLDGETLQLIGQWKIEEPFTGAILLPNQDHIAIFGKKMSTIQIYSLSKGEFVEEWHVGTGIMNAVLINDQTELALVDQNRDSIRILSLNGEELREVEVGNNPISLIEDEKHDRLFVVNFKDDKISVLHSKTLKRLQDIEVNQSSAGILLLEDVNELWIGGHGEGMELEENVHVYSAEKGNLVTTINAPFMPIKFLEWENSVFILSHGSNTIYKYNRLTKEMESKAVGVNPFEISSYQNYVVIAAYDSDEVFLLNPNSFTVEKKVKVDKGPFQILVRE